MRLNTPAGFGMTMKYLYCPNCKELRIKPWYSFRNRCLGCFGDATVIDVPNSWMTYATYVLYVLVPLLVVFYLTLKDTVWIFGAIALLVVMVVLQLADMMRGEKIARARIKFTVADSSLRYGKRR